MLVAEGKENDQGPGTGGRATESDILYYICHGPHPSVLTECVSVTDIEGVCVCLYDKMCPSSCDSSSASPACVTLASERDNACV